MLLALGAPPAVKPKLERKSPVSSRTVERPASEPASDKEVTMRVPSFALSPSPLITACGLKTPRDVSSNPDIRNAFESRATMALYSLRNFES
jgi:hypothetical protein